MDELSSFVVMLMCVYCLFSVAHRLDKLWQARGKNNEN